MSDEGMPIVPDETMETMKVQTTQGYLNNLHADRRNLEDENYELRRMLFQIQWQPQDYTDDGEMQSQAGNPFTDFKRGSVSTLKEAVEIRRKEQREKREEKIKKAEEALSLCAEGLGNGANVREASFEFKLEVAKEVRLCVEELRIKLSSAENETKRVERDLREAYAALQAAAKALVADDKEELKNLLTKNDGRNHAYQIVRRMEKAEKRVAELEAELAR